jgi:cobalt-precorrin 5A hydrolase/precorrin-3B C17-methyltransferase
MVKPVILILGDSALPLAQQLKAALGGEIHAHHWVSGGDFTYQKTKPHLASLFKEGRTIIGLCASGIIIRSIAPLLLDKREEPPVLAVAEDGSTIVPLLGGHHGANALANRIAELTGGHAAITTASDVNFGVALDEPPSGYELASYDHVKEFTSRLLAGETVRINGSAPWLSQLPQSLDASLQITITDHDLASEPGHLVYHPLTLTVGVGCERGLKSEDVYEFVTHVLKQHNLSEWSVDCFASIDLKQDDPAINGILHKQVRYFTAMELRAQGDKIRNPSNVVEVETGTPSVSEAAALAAGGLGSELIVQKIIGNRMTCAIARSPTPITKSLGKERGQLNVVGVGPGSAYMRSRGALNVLSYSTDWVGYGLYLDLVADLKQNQTEHRFPLGGEEDRVRHAIELAKQGKQVALICSGDAGIYAMAALVYEIIDLEPNRISVDVIPGISAFQAAAAKAGAMIGHDFCCISLSDLLTPWDAIEKRVKAAAEGDFVISFYNPRSMKRRDQLERAFAILKNHRPPDTPVIIASNLGRPQENVRIVKFADFNPDDVDMLTLVMVGSSQSKSFARGDGRTYAYTPRGYARKRETP